MGVNHSFIHVAYLLYDRVMERDEGLGARIYLPQSTCQVLSYNVDDIDKPRGNRIITYL